MWYHFLIKSMDIAIGPSIHRKQFISISSPSNIPSKANLKWPEEQMRSEKKTFREGPQSFVFQCVAFALHYPSLPPLIWNWLGGNVAVQDQEISAVFFMFKHPCLAVSTDLVNCPTWWSLLFIFGFLCWSSYFPSQIQRNIVKCYATSAGASPRVEQLLGWGMGGMGWMDCMGLNKFQLRC